MLWPYSIHLRGKNLVYLAVISLFLYLWYYILSVGDLHINLYRASYVNFKHLLVACVMVAQKGGIEVRNASTNLEISSKGKTKEGVLDVLTSGDKRSNMVMVNSLLYTFPGIMIISEEHLPSQWNVVPLNINSHLLSNSMQYSSLPDDLELRIEDLVIWVDPLDATKEYSEGLTDYVTTMVCVVHKGEPLIGVIHQPFQQRTYWASKFGIDKQLLALRSQFLAPNEQLRFVISRSHKGDVKQWIKDSLNDIDLTITEAAGSGYKTLQLLFGKADIYLHKTYIKKWDICAPNTILKYATEGKMSSIDGETIDYGIESDFVHKHGVFASAKPDLVSIRNKLNKHYQYT